MVPGPYGLVVLCMLAGCSTPHTLDEQQLSRLRTVEVVIDVPDGNFVYYGVDTASSMPYVAPPPGVSVGTAFAANVLFGILVASIDRALLELARDASLPVSKSVQDLDMRGMAFSHLKEMAAASPHAPMLSLSDQPFPPADEITIGAHTHPTANPSPGTTRFDPLKPMAERATVTRADATLFVKVLPLFTLNATTPSVLRSAAWLYDKSGGLLYSSSATFVGPSSPNVERADAVAWWANARYRRLIAQGVRAVMLPLGENLTQPALAARRRSEFEVSATPKVDLEKLMASPQRSLMSRGQESAANAARMRSTACVVNSDDPRLTYRYERHGLNELVVVSGYCPGETLELWNQELVPGMSWLSEQNSAPRVISSAK